MVTHKPPIKAHYRPAVILSLVMLQSAVVCFTVDYSINELISWSLYPAGGLIVLWAAITPLLIMKKNKLPASFSGLTITLVSYLFLIQWLVPAKGWVIPLALPIAIISLAAFGISLLVFNNFVSINKLYGAAITVFLFGVVVNFATGKIIYAYLKMPDFNDLPRTLTISGSIITALILLAIGYIKNSKQRRANQLVSS